MNTCNYCNSNFSTNQSLKRHYSSCKEKQKQVKEQYIQNLQKQHQEQIEGLQKQHQEKIQGLQKKLEEQQIQYEKQIEKMEKQIEKMEAQLFEIAKQPKQVTNTNTQTTNNRILNITNNLVPMDLTDEQIREILKNKYTREIFLGGPDSITEMTVSQLLTDQETGKFRIVCTDTSRNVFYYQDCDENLVKDIGMEVVHKKIQKPLVEATSSHFTKIDNEKSMDDDELCILLTENISFIDHELPNKLKRKLQLPVNAQE